ncbi:MAG: glycosyltransferase family 2 protein [Candidatus Omnitrophica bacterium]|nr:glycosyltransferase family 2 protein [Candidatus Omnitrophota bacterium]
MYNQQKVSIILPAYNEEKNIGNEIENFFATGVVDEVIAVDNNSSDGTAEQIKKTRAKYIREGRQGYGYALRRGLQEAAGDLVFTCEPDGSFLASDLLKFLAYVDHFDVVFGTRTSKALIWEGAKMDWFLRLGNVVVAKILEYLHNGPCLTDVGCTFKMIKSKPLKGILREFRVGGSDFSPEFMILCVRHQYKCVEIPVNYKKRIGDSKITSSTWKAFKLGIKMIALILRYRMISINSKAV